MNITPTAFLRTAYAAQLSELLKASENGSVSVPECRMRITRTAILREMAHRGILPSPAPSFVAEVNRETVAGSSYVSSRSFRVF